MNTTRNILRSTLLSGAALLASAPAARAQVDPQEAVRKIVEQVNEEMRSIDRLLLESSRQESAGGASEVDRLRELMDRTKDSQGSVVRGIDQLIDELQNMAQQQQQQQSQGQPQDQQQGQGQPQQRDGQEQQPGEGQRQPGTRRETDTPDMVEQPGQQPGQQPGENVPAGQQPQPGEEPQEGDVADGGQNQRNPGQNRQTGNAREGSTEELQRAADAERWGDLQKYVPPQYQRAGAPEVPAKYRRLHEAFQKRAHERSGGR